MKKVTRIELAMKKIPQIEGIRGIAALMVVYNHMPPWTPYLEWGLKFNGYLFVDLFFVLSGFVICGAYSSHLKNIKQVKNFILLRIGRLVPVHYLFLCLFLVIEISKYFAEKMGYSFGVSAFKTNGILEFFEQLTLTQSIIPFGNPNSFNGPAWSISTEFYTYVIFSFFCLFQRKRLGQIAAVLLIVSLLCLVTDNTFGLKYFLRCVAGFFAGCICLFLSKKISVKAHSAFFIAASTMFLLFLIFKPYQMYDWFVYPLSMFLVVSAVVTRSGALSTALKSRPISYLGEISYSLYMSHIIFINIAVIVINRIYSTSLIAIHHEKVAAQLPWDVIVLLYILLFPLIIFVSDLVYSRIEVPFRKKMRIYVSQRPV